MKKLRKLTMAATVLAFVVALLSTFANCQTTSGGLIAFSQQAFNNATGTGASAIFRNVNQASHWLFYCTSGNTTSVSIQLEQSADKTTWSAISQVGNIAGGCGLVYASGYYSYVRANVTQYGSTGAGTINAWYSAFTGAITPPPNVGTSTTSQIVTQTPIVSTAPLTALKSTPQQLGASGQVVYGASIYNPNASVVYVSFNSNNSGAPSAGFAVVAVPATTSMVVDFPAPGVYAFGASTTFVQCSSSLTAQADPATGCLVQPYYKTPATTNGVPN